MASQKYLDWCRHVGVELGPIEAAFVRDGGRGVVATLDIQPGDALMQVPERLLLSRASAERDPVLSLLLQQHRGSLSPYQVLGVHLLHEAAKAATDCSAPNSRQCMHCELSSSDCNRGSSNAESSKGTASHHKDTKACNSCGCALSSFWGPYIEELPRSYTTMAYFTPSDVAALQVPSAQEHCLAAAEKTKQEWKGALPLIRQLGLPKKYCSLGAWTWASSTLLSRTMYVPWDEAGCLMPFGDLHNYQPPPGPHITSILEEEEQAASKDCAEDTPGALSGDGAYDHACGMYKLYARRPYKTGEQVYLCYGAHTNLELLELYGFVLDHNPHDKAMIPKGALQAAMAGDALKLAGSTQKTGHRTSRRADRAACHDSQPNGFSDHEQQQQQTQQGGCACGSPQGCLPPYNDEAPLLPQLSPSESFLHSSGAPSWGLLQALRATAATSHERKAFANKLAANERVSVAGDIQVLQWVLDACLLQLASLPSSVKADEDLVSQMSASRAHDTCGAGCLELAVQWRLCYKRILRLGAQRALQDLEMLHSRHKICKGGKP